MIPNIDEDPITVEERKIRLEELAEDRPSDEDESDLDEHKIRTSDTVYLPFEHPEPITENHEPSEDNRTFNKEAKQDERSSPNIDENEFIHTLAPAQKSRQVSIFKDKNCEELCFPEIFQGK